MNKLIIRPNAWAMALLSQSCCVSYFYFLLIIAKLAL